MDISIHSLSSSPKLPYLHQSPILGQKGVQVRLKGSQRDWEKGWRMTCWTHTTCVNQWPSCFNARGKRSSQYSSCKLAAKEKPQTTEASYFHQKKTPPQQLPWNLFWLTKAPSAILLRPHWMQSNWNLLKNNYKEKCTWQRRPSSCLTRTWIQKV